MKRNIFFTSLIFLVYSLSLSAEIPVIDPGDSQEFLLPAQVSYERENPVNGDSSVDWTVEKDAVRIEISSYLADSAYDSGYAQVQFSQPFLVSGDRERSVDATVTGNVSWKGMIIAGGELGANSGVTISLSLWDSTTKTMIETYSILDETCVGQDDVACGIEPSGSEDISLTTALVRGHEYELHLTTECRVESGEMEANAMCVFEHGSPMAEDGCIRWNGFAVTLDYDIVGMLEDLATDQQEIMESLQDLKSGQEELEADHEELEAAHQEIIMLLKTPEEDRPGWDEEGY